MYFFAIFQKSRWIYKRKFWKLKTETQANFNLSNKSLGFEKIQTSFSQGFSAYLSRNSEILILAPLLSPLQEYTFNLF